MQSDNLSGLMDPNIDFQPRVLLSLTEMAPLSDPMQPAGIVHMAALCLAHSGLSELPHLANASSRDPNAKTRARIVENRKEENTEN